MAPVAQKEPAGQGTLSLVRPAQKEPAGHMTPAAESDEVGQ